MTATERVEYQQWLNSGPARKYAQRLAYREAAFVRGVANAAESGKLDELRRYALKLNEVRFALQMLEDPEFDMDPLAGYDGQEVNS